MKVEVYFNLHRKVWSVRNAKTKRLVGHASRLLLRDATFKVSEAGRQRVLRERKKNVHAFVRGELEAAAWGFVMLDHQSIGTEWNLCKRSNNAYARAANRLGEEVSYNPYKGPSFYRKWDGAEVAEADMVYMTLENHKGRVMAFDPCQMSAEESAMATE